MARFSRGLWLALWGNFPRPAQNSAIVQLLNAGSHGSVANIHRRGDLRYDSFVILGLSCCIRCIFLECSLSALSSKMTYRCLSTVEYLLWTRVMHEGPILEATVTSTRTQSHRKIGNLLRRDRQVLGSTRHSVIDCEPPRRKGGIDAEPIISPRGKALLIYGRDVHLMHVKSPCSGMK